MSDDSSPVPYLTDHEFVAMLLEQERHRPLETLLARPENAEMRREWDAVELLQAQVVQALQRALTGASCAASSSCTPPEMFHPSASGYVEAAENARFVAGHVQDLARRRFLISRLVGRALMLEPTAAFAVRVEKTR